MLVLRLTQKLAASLRVPLPVDAPSATDPCADWCCHKFTVNRFRYILITNALTYYSVVLRVQGMGNESDFIAGVVAGLHSYLRGAGHELAFAEVIAPAAAEVRFSRVADRRILGVMNEFIFMAKLYLEDLSLVETADRLNECPVGPLKGKCPSDIFPPRGAARGVT
jgi:hypothetical protein